MKERLTAYGIALGGISLLAGLFYLMIKYPPPIIIREDIPHPQYYSPYPHIELEHRFYLESKLLDFRRTA